MKTVENPSTAVTPVTVLSKCDVKMALVSEDSNKPHYLTPWDVLGFNFEYIRFGLLFNKPANIHLTVDRLRNSLAATLTHFFPLSGRFVTKKTQIPPSYSVYVDCKDTPGAEFVHALASTITISDILTPTDVPRDVINSLFALPHGILNMDGHTLPLLAVQVTELVDGIFIAFTANHALVDGASFWHFINSYSEISRSSPHKFTISRPPAIKSWFLNDQVHIPGHHPNPNDGGFSIATPPQRAHRRRIFHLTSKALANLKANANSEYGTHNISSFQALAAMIWRSITRARGLRSDQLTTCAVPINCRSKFNPPLSDAYFGNCLINEYVTCTVNELLINDLGCAAWRLHDAITSCDNNRVRSYFEQFSPVDCTMADDPGLVVIGNSPMFNVYGNNFGWGNPLAARWSCNVFDGCVVLTPGRDKGSVDLTVDLFSEFMNALESDDEFIHQHSMRLSKL